MITFCRVVYPSLLFFILVISFWRINGGTFLGYRPTVFFCDFYFFEFLTAVPLIIIVAFVVVFSYFLFFSFLVAAECLN